MGTADAGPGLSREPACHAIPLREQGFVVIIKVCASRSEAIWEEVLFLLEDF